MTLLANVMITLLIVGQEEKLVMNYNDLLVHRIF